MAKEIARRLDMSKRMLTIDVEDYFGVISTHSIPLTGDHCPHCKHALPGSNGSPDIEASVAAIIQDVREVADVLIAKLDKVNHPEIQRHVELAKVKRNGH